MTAAVTVRPLTAADRDSWMPLWRGYQAFYRVDIPAATSDAAWARLLDPAEPMDGALAWQDGEAAGQAIGQAVGQAVGLVHLVRHRSFWTVGDYCYLQDLFVRDGLRGGGIGRALIEYAYGWAAERGCSRVHWLTHETNAGAMALYDRVAERSGFVQYRRLLTPP